MKSPAYWSSACYEVFLKYIWRQTKNIQEQQGQAVVKWIPKGAQVVEVAAGTGRFYRHALAGHVGNYLAIDINPPFVNYLKKQGIDATVADIRTDAVPPADVVIIISAFYHFKEMAPAILDKLLAAARDRLIILEPVVRQMILPNWRHRLRAALVNIGEGPIYHRYQKEELEVLCRAHGTLEYSELLPGNACLCVVRGRRLRDSLETVI